MVFNCCWKQSIATNLRNWKFPVGSSFLKTVCLLNTRISAFQSNYVYVLLYYTEITWKSICCEFREVDLLLSNGHILNSSSLEWSTEWRFLWLHLMRKVNLLRGSMWRPASSSYAVLEGSFRIYNGNWSQANIRSIYAKQTGSKDGMQCTQPT